MKWKDLETSLDTHGPTQGHGAAGAKARTEVRALVAEDNEMCKRILAKQLGGLGVVDLHVVDNGLEAGTVPLSLSRSVPSPTPLEVALDGSEAEQGNEWEERETLPRVQGGTMLSPWPPCNVPRASARVPGRLIHLTYS